MVIQVRRVDQGKKLTKAIRRSRDQLRCKGKTWNSSIHPPLIRESEKRPLIRFVVTCAPAISTLAMKTSR